MACTLTRLELYKMVWSESLRTLAPKVGVSDVALRNACRKADIPRPPRGYWARKNKGKITNQPMLPERFPGASHTIEFGVVSGENWREDLLNNPIPAPATFNEDIDSLRARAKKMIGYVEYPSLANKTHPLIRKLLEQDEERIREYKKSKFSWYAPHFDSPIEKRRLRILNALFLSARRIGCKADMSTSKYATEDRNMSIRVGGQYISFSLKAIQTRSGSKKSIFKKKLHFSINGNNNERFSFADDGNIKIDKHIDMILSEIVIAAEVQYRDRVQSQHQWAVDRKNELEEQERQRKIDEARIARELLEQQEKERIDTLLNHADNLQKAKVIRELVSGIRENEDIIDATSDSIAKWTTWALTQADRIDPILNCSFLNADADTILDNT